MTIKFILLLILYGVSVLLADKVIYETPIYVRFHKLSYSKYSTILGVVSLLFFGLMHIVMTAFLLSSLYYTGDYSILYYLTLGVTWGTFINVLVKSCAVQELVFRMDDKIAIVADGCWHTAQYIAIPIISIVEFVLTAASIITPENVDNWYIRATHIVMIIIGFAIPFAIRKYFLQQAPYGIVEGSKYTDESCSESLSDAEKLDSNVFVYGAVMPMILVVFIILSTVLYKIFLF